MKRFSVIFLCITALAVFAAWAPSANAYQDFGANNTNNNCQACHKIFGSGSGDPEHDAHATASGGGCGTCHGGFPVQLGNNCTQCHSAAGLRQHHRNSQAHSCSGCHNSPETAAPEDTVPSGYGGTALDPCDGSEENFASNTVSLDNDGDLCYDGDDPDCGGTGIGTESNCDDNLDNDCDGLIDGNDPDCSPACIPSTEICDGQDNDCDGQVDEGIVPTATTCGTGECASTGQMVCQGGILVDTCTEGTPSAETCDNLDNDCDGSVDENLTRGTTCGVGECSGNTGTETCVSGVWGNDTCNPLAGAVAEICTDSLDNDCDGNVNNGCPQPTETACFDGRDNDNDGQADCADTDCNNAVGAATNCGIGECASTGQMVCQGGSLVDTCTEKSASAETCDNLDNDCDGQVDEGIAPTSTTCGIGACEATGERICQNGSFVDTCQPGTAGTEGPFGDATCSDAIDNDCDGTTDTGDTNCENVISCVDGDGDGYGSPGHSSCANGAATDCDDNNAAINPGATEIPYNGVDDDCNSQTPDNDLDRDGFGNPTDCNDGNPAINPAASENCTDGVDNDCDGLADAADPDCQDNNGSNPPADHTDEEDGFMHKPGKDEPYSKGCTLCHGSDLTGGIGPSCFSCHGKEWSEDPIAENCTDGVDNDADGAVDCADSDCTGDQECARPDPEVCDDGVDNDGDALVDCDDIADCTGDSACQADDDEPGTHPFGGWTDAVEQHEDYVEDNGPDECRACHGQDLDGGTESTGSAPSCFSCHGAEWVDGDGDSVSDEKEKGHGRKDDHYDGNKDGKPDKGQKKVASFPTASGEHYITIESTGDIEQVESTEPAGDETAGFNLPYGEMEFTITDVEPGGFATVNIYTDGEYVDTYYLFDENGSAWEFTYDSGSDTGAVVGEFEVTLHLVDGGAGDRDGTVNGSISVAGAPASTAPAMELTSPAPGSAGGCAIVDRDGSATGMKGALGLLLLAGIWFAARRRKRKAPDIGK